MKLSKLLTIASLAALSVAVSASSFAESPRLSHTKPTSITAGKFYNDVTVVNYSNWVVNLDARFQDGEEGHDQLQPYGAPNNGYIEYFDLHNDSSVYVTVSAPDGAILFDGPLGKGQTANVYPDPANAKHAKVTIK